MECVGQWGSRSGQEISNQYKVGNSSTKGDEKLLGLDRNQQDLNLLLQPQNSPKQPLLAGVHSNSWVLSHVSNAESQGIDLRIVGRRLLCWRK